MSDDIKLTPVAAEVEKSVKRQELLASRMRQKAGEYSDAQSRLADTARSTTRAADEYNRAVKGSPLAAEYNKYAIRELNLSVVEARRPSYSAPSTPLDPKLKKLLMKFRREYDNFKDKWAVVYDVNKQLIGIDKHINVERKHSQRELKKTQKLTSALTKQELSKARSESAKTRAEARELRRTRTTIVAGFRQRHAKALAAKADVLEARERLRAVRERSRARLRVAVRRAVKDVKVRAHDRRKGR